LLILRPQVLGRETSDMVVRFVPALAKFLRRPAASSAASPSSALPATLGEQHL
jgi:lipopolysaccharide exporter